MSTQANSPHYADKLAIGILDWQKKNRIASIHVDDMKTPSGRVHTGSLVGAVLHDLVAKVLSEKTDQKVVSTFVINDMDPMDGLPSYLDPIKYQPHMGKPLYKIETPSLDHSGIDFTNKTSAERKKYEQSKNFAQFYATDFIEAIRAMGCSQEIIWSHEFYESGQMDEIIKTALDEVNKFKTIYKQIADYDLPYNWFPFQVICPKCGKLGTTLVTEWDGQKVTFECQANKVEWAQGCGHTGKISPFGGTGKLLWKVDWPAHWKVLGVTVEGAGKDHTSAGGSRDMANAICQQIFDFTPPFDIPYEWILVRGAKMSSSKGIGTSAREFTELLPPEVGRFLFVNKHYNQVLDFDPSTMAIADLFDLYDQAAQIFWGDQAGDERLGRSFQLSQLDHTSQAHFLPRFRDVALWMQHPELNLVEEFEKIKGSALSETEKSVLEQRKTYAQIWVDRYAPDEYQLTPSREMPTNANQLTADQKKYLLEVEKLISSNDHWEAEQLQQELFELAKTSLGAKLGFQAIYLAFLGKKSGPRAAWFLLSIDEKLRSSRYKEITGT